MIRISEIRQKRKNEELRKEIRQRMMFNHHMRNMETGEKRMKQITQSMRQKAIEAEKAGDHNSAVRFAAEAERLAKQLRVTGDMKDTVMGVRAVSESARALTGILKDVNEMTGVTGAPGPADMVEMQISMETAKENMDYMMETAGEAYDSLTENDSSVNREEGEKALKSLMKTAEREKRKSILMETSKKLDAMTRNRVTD